MMRIFDTHCHLADPLFDGDLEEVIARMAGAGVCRANVVADPCEDVPNQDKALSIVRAHEGFVCSVGVHPHNARRYTDETEKELLRCLDFPECRLLGEIGLDYHYDLSPRDVQREVFDRQLELAHARGLRVQLHIREAHGECMDMLRSRAASGRLPEGIMHCYTGSWEAAKVYLDLGYCISLSGALTFKNAPKLTEVAKNVPADRLLIETDCPYMAPVPLRGRRNEPANLVYTLSVAAKARGVSPEALSEQLWANSLRAFGLAEEAGA